MFDLKSFRKSKGLSQKELARILGIGPSFVSQIETGRDPMPDYVPEKLAREFGAGEVEQFVIQGDTGGGGALGGVHLFPSNGATYFSPSAPKRSKNDAPADAELERKRNQEWIERVLLALERRDELAMLQQKEYERQGERIDQLLEVLRKF